MINDEIPVKEKWWERFLTMAFWHDLFTIKYWRHRKVVVARTNFLMKERRIGFVQARGMAWMEELEAEYKEGKEGWG